MRKKERQTDQERAYALLATLEVGYLAALDPTGAPVLRALHPVLARDWLLFHGAFAGEKAACQGPALLSGHRTIAEIPSYFVDPELACPATTYYESVEARGQLSEVTSPELKDAMLEALMKKYQPEGGHKTINSREALYTKQVRATRVFGFRIEQIAGKLSAGQDRPVERVEKVVRGLFRRGLSTDFAAIEEILSYKPDARPDFLRHRRGDLFVSLTPERARAHARLLEGQYWRRESSQAEIESAILASSAWVGLVDPEGALLGAARAITDTVWTGTISDVAVHPDCRRQGIGSALMTLLMNHPRVRDVRWLQLRTADQAAFYRKFGFQHAEDVPLPFASHPMVRVL